MGPLDGLLGIGLGIPHSAAVVAGYALVFGALLFWVFLRRDID
jgi:ABC-type transport system involved in multi-copper enzyme maturation permease subunit